jgi:ubiquinone/menaquinone biosynthesis C-methylase UbiE
VKKSEFLLDLRCGGGWELLTKKATKVVGVDFSRPSLKVAKKLHYDCVEANIEHLPLVVARSILSPAQMF